MPARPATTDDLNRLEHRLCGEMAEMRTELRGEMAEMRTELRGEMAEMRTELRGELAGLATKVELAEMRTELRGEMAGLATKAELAAVKAELVQHIADASVHTANVVVEQMREELARHTAASAEQTRKLIEVIDDRYRDLPGEVATLRRELDNRCPPAGDEP